MKISEIRNDLHGRIEQADDEELLKIYDLMLNYENSQVDDTAEWNALPQWQQDFLERSIRQADAGETVSLETVIENIRQKYGLNE